MKAGASVAARDALLVPQVLPKSFAKYWFIDNAQFVSIGLTTAAFP
jgi:hypothetical protein